MTPTPATQVLRLGTRGSRLALVQTGVAAERIGSLVPGLRVDVHTIRTRGDRDTDSPLPQIGGRGLFTEALEHALIAGEIDAAVHSLKDLPLEASAGVITAAICCRDDARDVLISRVSRPLNELPAGSVIGTSSTRRAAQLRAVRPDLVVRSIRGNVDTRVDRVRRGEYDAAIVAAAGLRRLGLEAVIAEYLPIDHFPPAPGQGALAIQCHEADGPVRAVLEEVDDAVVRACTSAERAFLAGLGGGCSLPVGALAMIDGDEVRLDGWVGAIDGSHQVRVHGRAAVDDATELGLELARQAIAGGAAALLP